MAEQSQTQDAGSLIRFIRRPEDQPIWIKKTRKYVDLPAFAGIFGGRAEVVEEEHIELNPDRMRGQNCTVKVPFEESEKFHDWLFEVRVGVRWDPAPANIKRDIFVGSSE